MHTPSTLIYTHKRSFHLIVLQIIWPISTIRFIVSNRTRGIGYKINRSSWRRHRRAHVSFQPRNFVMNRTIYDTLSIHMNTNYILVRYGIQVTLKTVVSIHACIFLFVFTQLCGYCSVIATTHTYSNHFDGVANGVLIVYPKRTVDLFKWSPLVRIQNSRRL